MASTSLRKSLLVAIIFIIISASWVNSCNETICASIVSKCMLLNSCKCDLTTCSCCKECFLCLSFLYDECCSCFDLCPRPNVTNNPLSKKSHVEDFEEPFPELFRALTEDPDHHGRWTSLTYLVDFPLSLYETKLGDNIKYYLQTAYHSHEYSMQLGIMTLNCTVTFMADCNSWAKCKQSCQAMGATSYRWFHDGCCECIGHTCINYGINESRCINCPPKIRDINGEEYDDYGQDFEIMDNNVF